MRLQYKILASLLLLSAFSVILVANLSVTRLLALEDFGIEYDSFGDARLWRGQLAMHFVDYPQLGLVQLNWHLCPSLSGFEWCLQGIADDFDFQTLAGYAGDGMIRVRDLEFNASELAGFGLAPSLFAAQVAGKFDYVLFNTAGCPLANLQASGGMQLTASQILGTSLGAVGIAVTDGEGGRQFIDLTGDRLQGRFELDPALNFSGSGEISPPQQLHAMMQSLARPLGNGRFAWELQGVVPC